MEDGMGLSSPDIAAVSVRSSIATETIHMLHHLLHTCLHVLDLRTDM